jgi:hypothetical protein
MGESNQIKPNQTSPGGGSAAKSFRLCQSFGATRLRDKHKSLWLFYFCVYYAFWRRLHGFCGNQGESDQIKPNQTFRLR